MQETPSEPDKTDSGVSPETPLPEVVMNAMLLNSIEFLGERRKTSIREAKIEPPEEPPEIIP